MRTLFIAALLLGVVAISGCCRDGSCDGGPGVYRNPCVTGYCY